MVNTKLGAINNSVVIMGSVTNTSIVNQVASQGTIFEQLRVALKSVSDVAQRNTLNNALADLESHLGKADFTTKYKHFVQLAADHMTILAPFLPELFALIG